MTTTAERVQANVVCQRSQCPHHEVDSTESQKQYKISRRIPLKVQAVSAKIIY